MGKLTKIISLSQEPGSPGTPATPGSPGRPGYCYEVSEQQLVIHPAPGGRFIWIEGTGGDPGGWTWLPGTGSDSISYKTVKRIVCLPPVDPTPPTPGTPATPSQMASDFGIGWNAGAISVRPFEGDRGFFFRIPQGSVGVAAGLGRTRRSDGWSDIDYSIKATHGLFQVVERGQAKTDAAAFTSETQFAIQRIGQTIHYTVDGDIIYTSTIAAPYPLIADASLYMGGDSIDAAAFGEPDMNATPGQVDVALEPMQVFGYAGTDNYAAVDVSFEPMEVEVTSEPADVRVRFAPMQVLAADYNVAAVQVSLAPMTVDAGAEPPGEELPFAIAVVQFPAMTLQATADAAYRRLTMQPMQLLAADYAYAGASLTMRPPSVLGYDFLPVVNLMQLEHGGGYQVQFSATAGQPNRLVVRSPMPQLQAAGGAVAALAAPRCTLAFLGTVDNIGRAALVAPAAQITFRATVANVAAAALRAFPLPLVAAVGGASARLRGPACMLQASGHAENIARASLTLTGHYTLLATASAENYARAALLCPQPEMGRRAWMQLQLSGYQLLFTAGVISEPEYLAYAVNLVSDAKGGGNEVTQFTNWPFEQVVRFGGDYYGVARDGVYPLGGDNDAGEPIAWEWHTAKTDFGTERRKTVHALVVGGRLGPQAEVAIAAGEDPADSEVYSYTNPRGAVAQNYRQKFGRGLKARWVSFGASDDAGGELHVDSLAPEVQELERSV